MVAAHHAVQASDDPPLLLLETRATPAEYLGEWDAAHHANDAGRMAEFAASATGSDLAGFAALQPYVRHELAEGATLYRGPGARRRLLIAFTGRRDRLGVPIPVFLQRMDAQLWDVLLLRDAQHCHYRLGVAGIGPSPVMVHKWLAKHASRYRLAATFGTSAGALPAVWAGMALGVERILCLSGQRPQDVQRLFGKGPVPTAFDAACACVSDSGPRRILVAYGSRHAADAQFSRQTAAQLQAHAFGVPGCTEHAMPAFLWKNGQLQSFLNAILVGRMDARFAGLLARSVKVEKPLPAAVRADQIPAIDERVAPDDD